MSENNKLKDRLKYAIREGDGLARDSLEEILRLEAVTKNPYLERLRNANEMLGEKVFRLEAAGKLPTSGVIERITWLLEQVGLVAMTEIQELPWREQLRATWGEDKANKTIAWLAENVSWALDPDASVRLKDIANNPAIQASGYEPMEWYLDEAASGDRQRAWQYGNTLIAYDTGIWFIQGKGGLSAEGEEPNLALAKLRCERVNRALCEGKGV